MTDIFKSADWAREAEEKKRAPARPVYVDENGDLWTITYYGNDRVRLSGGPVVFDPDKLTAEEREALRQECLRPGGFVYLGEDPDSPQWSQKDIEFLTGAPAAGSMKDGSE